MDYILSCQSIQFIHTIYSGILSGGGTNSTSRQGCKILVNRAFLQDPLESFFGDQRSRGHWNSNPTVQQYSVTANILCVSSGLSRIERGNVRGIPLPPQQRH